MKLFKFLAISGIFTIFMLSVIGMSFCAGTQYAKNEINKLKEDNNNLVISLNDTETKYKDFQLAWQHAAWHYNSQAESLYQENERLNQLLMTGKTYTLDYEFSDDWVTGRRYKVITPEPITIIKEVQKPLFDWNSLDELKTFLKEDDTDSHSYFIANEDGEVLLDGRCRVKAEQLRNNAEVIGKRLETESLTRLEYIVYYDKKWEYGRWDRHDICKARIGNLVYFVEPQNDKVWLAYYIPN